MNVKSRMAEIGMTQVEMILELNKRGFSVQPPMMSSILRGVYTYPKAKRISINHNIFHGFYSSSSSSWAALNSSSSSFNTSEIVEPNK